MRWIPRLRMLLARRPWLYWLFVMCCAATVGVVLMSTFADVRRQRDAWGRTATVVVATREVAAGERLAGAVSVREVPVAVVPSSALSAVPAEATATQRISVGELVVGADISSARQPLALLPQGWLAIEIPRADGGLDGVEPLFEIGDAASVLADGSMIAEHAVVVGASPDGVAVGVPREVAARVAQAANQHTAVVALGRG